MNRIKLVAIIAVLGIAAFVAMSSIYTVSGKSRASDYHSVRRARWVLR